VKEQQPIWASDTLLTPHHCEVFIGVYHSTFCSISQDHDQANSPKFPI